LGPRSRLLLRENELFDGGLGIERGFQNFLNLLVRKIFRAVEKAFQNRAALDQSASSNPVAFAKNRRQV
jgi:hypothetical protein